MEISMRILIRVFCCPVFQILMERVPHLYITLLLGYSTSETASPVNFFCCTPKTHTLQTKMQYPVPGFLLHPKFISGEGFRINFKEQKHGE
jgi:hypothetical protein